MAEPLSLCVEVVCALPERQLLLPLEVAHGTTARAAVVASAIQEHFPQLDISACRLGIFGTEVADDYQLMAGDRIEILRPLINEPRATRRALAARGATMGGGRSVD